MVDPQVLSDETARLLVASSAVSFRTSPFFRFTSGVESPIYVDNRRLLGFPLYRRSVVAMLHQVVEARVFEENIGAVAGTATAGIPWAAWLADRLELPLLYVRSTAKQWGHERSVEGTASPGARVLIVEDLLYSAGSAVNSAEHLRAHGYEADDCIAIVTYGTDKAALRLEDASLTGTALTDLASTVAVAAQEQLLDAGQVDTVLSWLSNAQHS